MKGDDSKPVDGLNLDVKTIEDILGSISSMSDGEEGADDSSKGNRLKESFFLKFYENYKKLKYKKEREEKEEEGEKEKEKEKEKEEREEAKGKGKEKDNKEEKNDVATASEEDFSKAEEAFSKTIERIRNYKIENKKIGLEKCISLFYSILKAIEESKDEEEKELIITALLETIKGSVPSLTEKIEEIEGEKQDEKEKYAKELALNLIVSFYVLPLNNYAPEKASELIKKLCFEVNQLEQDAKLVRSLEGTRVRLPHILGKINTVSVGFYEELYKKKAAQADDEAQEDDRASEDSKTKALDVLDENYFQLITENYHLFKNLQNLADDSSQFLETIEKSYGQTNIAGGNITRALKKIIEKNSEDENYTNLVDEIKNAIIIIQDNNKEKFIYDNESKKLHRYFYLLRILRNTQSNEEKLGIVDNALNEIESNSSIRIKENLKKHLDAHSKLSATLKEEFKLILNEQDNYRPDGDWRIRYANLLSAKLKTVYDNPKSPDALSEKDQEAILRHLEFFNRQLNSVNSPLQIYDPRENIFDPNLINLVVLKHKSIQLLLNYKNNRESVFSIYYLPDKFNNNDVDNKSKNSRISAVDSIIKQFFNCKEYKDYVELLNAIAEVFNVIPDKFSNLRSLLFEISHNITQALNIFSFEEVVENKNSNQRKKEFARQGEDEDIEDKAGKVSEKKEPTSVELRLEAQHIYHQKMFNVALIENLSLASTLDQYRVERITIDYTETLTSLFFFEKARYSLKDYFKSKGYTKQTEEQYEIISAINYFIKSEYDNFKDENNIAEFYTLYIEYCSEAIKVVDATLREKLESNRKTIINRFLSSKHQWPHFSNDQLNRIEAALSEKLSPDIKNHEAILKIINGNRKTSFEKLRENAKIRITDLNSKNNMEIFREKLANSIRHYIEANHIGATGIFAKNSTFEQSLINGVADMTKDVPFGGGMVVGAVAKGADEIIKSQEAKKEVNVTGAASKFSEIDQLADDTAAKVTLMYSYYLQHAICPTDVEELAGHAFLIIKNKLRSGLESPDLSGKSDELAWAVRENTKKFSILGLSKTKMRAVSNKKLTGDNLNAEDIFQSPCFLVINDKGEPVSYSAIADKNQPADISKSGIIVISEARAAPLKLQVIKDAKVDEIFKNKEERTAFETQAKKMHENMNKPEVVDNSAQVQELIETVGSLETTVAAVSKENKDLKSDNKNLREQLHGIEKRLDMLEKSLQPSKPPQSYIVGMYK
jgi:hypothetical protein